MVGGEIVGKQLDQRKREKVGRWGKSWKMERKSWKIGRKSWKMGKKVGKQGEKLKDREKSLEGREKNSSIGTSGENRN